MSETAAPSAAPAVTFRQLLILAGVAFAGLLVLLVAGVGGVYWAVNSGDGGGNRPAVLAADEAAEQSVRDYSAALADIYAMAAEGIKRGDIKSDAELFEYAKPAVDDARKQAFSAIDKSAESEIPNGEWSGRDTDDAIEWCENAANGFREVAE